MLLFSSRISLRSMPLLAGVAAAITAAPPKNLDLNAPASIEGAAKTVAQNIMTKYYTGTSTQFVDLEFPKYYWWECGALMGAMVDYSTYTGDTTYDPIVAEALLANIGPYDNYMLPSKYSQEGNDDLCFWGFAVLAAAETNFPQPDANIPNWLQLGENIWNSLHSRWNASTCDGGLAWQIFPSNPNGMSYKNSISNGGFMQLSARLYRDTGNTTYSDWASKIWDWLEGIGLISSADWLVYDGTQSAENCSSVNQQAFSYSQAIIMYAAAVMADATSDAVWTTRTENLLAGAKGRWFSPFDNATNIMYESACEKAKTCNNDMLTFKGYMSRFMFRSAQFVPSIRPTVLELLQTSALGAAQACTGVDGTTCGQHWYTAGYDWNTGLGQEMSALEIFQGLLSVNASLPYKLDQIQVVRSFDNRTASPPEPPASNATTTRSASSASTSSAVKSKTTDESDAKHAGSHGNSTTTYVLTTGGAYISPTLASTGSRATASNPAGSKDNGAGSDARAAAATAMSPDGLLALVFGGLLWAAWA